MYYFSYGSNMSIKRLLARVPSARKIGTGTLEKHELRFHKKSGKDGSAKCDAHETGDPQHRLHGVVFHISPDEKPNLDWHEGLGKGYETKQVTIVLADGSSIEAYTYYATDIDPGLKPLCWYREHVLRGARENELPAEHIRSIEIVAFDEDTDTERRERELSIYI